MWGWEYTVYVVPKKLFGNSWSDSKKVKIWWKTNYSKTEFTQYMEKTSYTYAGDYIYKYKIYDLTGEGADQITFQRFSASDVYEDGYDAFTSYEEQGTFADKIYIGYQSDAHRWMTYCHDATYYFIKTGTSASWDGAPNAHAWNAAQSSYATTTWPGTRMTDSGKTYQGKALYSITFNNPPYSDVKFNEYNGSGYSGEKSLPGNEGKIFDYNADTWLAYHYDHKVNFYGNGSTSGSMSAQTVPYNTATALNANGFSKSGYTFTGWNTKADGSGDAYAGGANITVTDADVDLYAQWAQTGYYLVGEFSEWNHADSCLMTATGVSNEVAVTLRFRAADFSSSSYKTQIKVRDWSSTSGTWYSNNDRGSSETINKAGNNPTTLSSSAGNNMYLDVSISAGSYTFKYNTSTKVLTVVFPVNNRIDFFSPSSSQDNMTLNDGVYSLEKTLTAGSTYTFKLEYLSDFYGDGSSFTATRTISNLTANSGNMSLTPTRTGTYTFTYDPSTKNFTVTYPISYSITVNKQTGISSVSGSVTYAAPSTNYPISATVATGYTFRDWVVSGSGASVASTTSSSTNAQVTTANGTFTARANETMHTVTLANNGHGHVEIGGATVTSGSAGIATSATITAVPDDGYHFVNWTKTDATVTLGSTTSVSTTMKATADGKTVTANFEADKYIYFDNTYTQWDEVWVYFFNNNCWWNSSPYGVHPRTNRVGYGQMTLVEGTENLYVFAYHSPDHNYSSFEGGSGNKVAFSSEEKDVDGAFWQTDAVYRGDWNSSLPIYVAPSKYTTTNETKYHNDGYWMMKETTAGESVGYSLRGGGDEIGKFKAVADGSHTATCTWRVAGTSDYYFFVNNISSQNYSLQDKVFSTPENSKNVSIYHFETFTPGSNSMTLRPNVVGDYVFTLTQGLDGLVLTITFPVQVGDHRLVYTFTEDEETKTRYSDVIETGVTSATASMYIDKGATSAALKLQRCNSIDEGTKKPVWGDVTGATGLISLFSAKEKGVYQFTVDITNKTLTDITAYAGDYYIKTDCAPGQWATYTNNKMHPNTIKFSKSDASTYDYYYCNWINNTSTNVRCVIANDYNNAISDTLFTDDILTRYEKEYETLPEKGNVRFSWNSYTNELKRTYLLGANDANSFLYIVPNAAEYVYDATDGTTDLSGEVGNKKKFKDNGNWTYQLDVKVYPGAKGGIKTNYPSFGTINYQELIPSTNELMGGTKPVSPTSEDLYNLRFVYDFKTNYLMSAWIPNGTTINDDINLNSDMMIVRNGQNNALQVSIGSGALSKVKRAYGVFQFNYADMVNKMNNWTENSYRAREQCMYYFSFPFDVNISDIFGVGKYGKEFIIQKYNGEKRAQIGWFQETSTFWETMDISDKLNAYEGYSLLLDREAFNDASNDVWTNISSTGSIFMYFPSSSTSIGSVSKTASNITVPANWCTINRTFDGDKNHKDTDSHWNLVGVPMYSNAYVTSSTGATTDQEGLTNLSAFSSYYSWNISGNSWTPNAPVASATFNSLHAYMVQWAGKISWAQYIDKPASIVARRESSPANYLVHLSLIRDDEEVDRAFVQLQDGANADFVLGEDMCKIVNSGVPNIYVYAGDYDVAYSQVPEENQTIPVGVVIRKAGDYTFSMPTNFSGTVTLIDTYNNTRTNLAMDDYEVYLEKGTVNDRFELEININKTPTAIDGAEDGSGSLKDGKAHKFLQDGVMYILNEGMLYDARGNRVR